MPLSPTIPYPVAQWTEPPSSGAAVPIARVYWGVDPLTGAWTLTTNPGDEVARLADPDHDGIYELLPLSAIGSATPVLRAAEVNGGAAMFY